MSELWTKLKECKTVKEVYENIPSSFYERVAKILLIALSFFPIISMIMNLINRDQTANIVAYYLMVLGYLGILLMIFKLIGYFQITPKEKKRADLKKYWYFPVFLAFILWIWICSFASESIHIAIFGDLFRREGALAVTSYSGFIFCGFLVNKKNKDCLQILDCYLIMGAILAFLTCIQAFRIPIVFFETPSRPKGFTWFCSVFHNSNHYGYYLLMQIVLLSGLFIVVEDKKRKIIYFSLMFLSMLTLILNNTFGCFFALCLTLIILVILFWIRKKHFDFRYLIPLFVLLLSSIIISFTDNPSVLSNFLALFKDVGAIVTDPSNSGDAGTGRWELWGAALEVFKSHPFFGVGPDGLGPFMFLKGDNDRPHNEFIQYLAFYGVFGLIFYLTLMIGVCLENLLNIRKSHPYSFVSFIVVIGYLISSFFGNTMYYTMPFFVFFIGLSIIKVEENVVEEKKEDLIEEKI